MSSTETNSADTLAESMFDDLLIPLARSADHRVYFARAGETGATSYFEPPTLAVMQLADFEFPGGGNPEGLVDALAAYWIGQGDGHLAAMAPRLKEIALALHEEIEESNGEVDILCYTMF